MLYRFYSKKSADSLMLKDLAQRIFDVMGRSLDDQGILLIEQLPALIEKLEQAIAKDEELRKMHMEDPENNPKLPDRLGQRAFPFLTLLKSALKNKDPVVWGV